MMIVVVWKITYSPKILDSKQVIKIKKEKDTLRALGGIVTILFVLGLILINVATYLAFSLTTGLYVTGITSLLVALIINYELGMVRGRR